MKTSDRDLAFAAAGGDRAAFAALVERHYDRVYRLAFRLTGRKADAEDLTQDVCAGLAAKLGAWRGEAQFTTWLYRIVVNAAHDRRRRAATHAKAAEGWGEVEVLRRADAQATDNMAAWLATAMQRLPEDLRDTVALVLDDLDHREAAEVLGLSEGTVSWRISRAKALLKEMEQADMA